jgi:predicted phage-related endonuclease
MPKFVIERQYLVPMYQHIVVAAASFEEACELALSDDISWESQEMDCDNARATTLTAAKAIPDHYRVDTAQQKLIEGPDPLGVDLALFLYGSEAETGALIEIPAKFTSDD